MSIGSSTSSHDHKGQRFPLSNVPFETKNPLSIEDLDLEEDIGGASTVVRPAEKRSSSSVGRRAPVSDSEKAKITPDNSGVTKKRTYDSRPTVETSSLENSD